jgi:hypothetical protein
MSSNSRAQAETKKKERTSPPVGQRRRYTVLSLRSSTIHIFFMSMGASPKRETRNRDTMGRERTRANGVGRGCLYYRNWEASKRGWRRHGWRRYQVDMSRQRGTLRLG